MTPTLRPATFDDLDSILEIYNHGIEDRIATLETDPKSREDMEQWFTGRAQRYEVGVAEMQKAVVGWASLNPYSHRCAYDGVADLSVYVARSHRGRGIGAKLLTYIEERARANGFHKIVLFTFPSNDAAQKLYRNSGFREVGTFREQGTLDGKMIDVMAMEKILR